MKLRKEVQSKHDNVRTLTNEYTQEQSQQLSAKRVAKKHSHRRLWLFLAVASTMLLFLGFQIYQSEQKLNALQSQMTTAKKDLKTKKQDQYVLKNQIRQLKDEGYVLKLVRGKYYLSKDGETIYSFAEDNQPVQNTKTIDDKNKK